MKKTKKGFAYFMLALLTFVILMADLLSIFIANYFTYGNANLNIDSSAMKNFQFITICRTIIYIIWGSYAYFIITFVKKKFNWDILAQNTKIKTWQILLILIAVFLSSLSSYIVWDGFKVYLEFLSNGAYGFILQYIYYIFEVILFTLIIVFGQKAFECWFKNENIPYGGIIVALTWGLVHWFTKGTLFDGLYGLINGFFFGGMYVILNKDVKKTFIVLYLMFIL